MGSVRPVLGVLLLASFVAVPIGAKLAYDRWRDYKYERSRAEDEEERRKREVELAAYRHEHEQRAFYCFLVQAQTEDDFLCYQGKDTCNDRRLDKLRTLTGAQVGDCVEVETVWRFKFACSDDPSKTCYVATDRQDSCEQLRAARVGNVNNLTPCAEVKIGY